MMVPAYEMKGELGVVGVPDLRKRLTAVLGREVHGGEKQGDLLVELLELLERIKTEEY